METLIECRKFKVVRDQWQNREGLAVQREFVVHPGAVVILPLIDSDRLLLIRQVRRTIGQQLWELPAGTLDVPGELPEAAAHRELEEETGYRAGAVNYLCEFYTSPGIMTELIRAYVARDLVKTSQKLEPTEEIEVTPMRMDETLEMVSDGRIVDAKTIVTLLRWDLQQRTRR